MIKSAIMYVICLFLLTLAGEDFYKSVLGAILMTLVANVLIF